MIIPLQLSFPVRVGLRPEDCEWPLHDWSFFQAIGPFIKLFKNLSLED